MAKNSSVNLDELSRLLREARERKGWTLEQLSHELWDRGLPTAQNKLWRLENNPPKRLDTELLLWLENVLEVQLIHPENKNQVLLRDVLELLDSFTEMEDGLPAKPVNEGLHIIYEKVAQIRKMES